jgi:hypothetical protein
MNTSSTTKAFITLSLFSACTNGIALSINDYIALNDTTYFVDQGTGDWIAIDFGYLSNELSTRCGHVVQKPQIVGTLEETDYGDGRSQIHMNAVVSNALAMAGNIRHADVHMGLTYLGQTLAAICYTSWAEPNMTGKAVIDVTYVTQNHQVLPLYAIPPIGSTVSIQVRISGSLISTPGISDNTPGFATTEIHRMGVNKLHSEALMVERITISAGR